MLWSKAFIPTLKEEPAEAELISHKLMLRAGMMRQVSSGIYIYLPLGWRAMRKVENIVREEMNRIGCQELLMPVLSPGDLWMETGRWDLYGPELMRLQDRHQRPFALGPTHEEVITDLIRKEFLSYRQLPLCLYQIQTKFRDEIRPRFGVMRAREFLMKDAYSFHRDGKDLKEFYELMAEAYRRVFQRCGLDFRQVIADSGLIGGDITHEYVVMSEGGETRAILCPNGECHYSATSDAARGGIRKEAQPQELLPLEEVRTPKMKTVEEVCNFLRVESRRLVKTLLYQGSSGMVAVLIRGDRELNEIKLRRLLGDSTLQMARAERVEALTGSQVGFCGPVGLRNVKLIADQSVEGMVNFITGANKDEYHLKNVNLGRDITVEGFEDLAIIRGGDACPLCDKTLDESKGIEVGQLFQLGEKYSQAMEATFTDRDGKRKGFSMGCYGIGISRTVAAAIEQSHDEKGIIWPLSLAPYEVLITPIKYEDPQQAHLSQSLYDQLKAMGVEVLLDDRPERPGVKFHDGDLIGIPYRLSIGPKGLREGKVGLYQRKTQEERLVPMEGAVSEVFNLIKAEKEALGGK